MGRRRRGRVFERFIVGGILVVIVVAVGPSLIEHLVTEQPWVLFWIVLILVLLGWGLFLFRMPTVCDVETKKGTPCDNNARGYFGACNQVRRHKDVKRRELAARIGFRAWANRARRMWRDQASSPSPPTQLNQPAPGNDEEPGRLCRNSYEAVSLACAVSSTGFGFVSTIVTVVTFVQSP